jgi:polar amino acid transport system substrate-binding protein
MISAPVVYQSAQDFFLKSSVSREKPDKLQEIMERGRLIIASYSSYPPHAERIPGSVRNKESCCDVSEYTADQMKGFYIDLSVNLSRRLGLEPCFVTPQWTPIASGSWDDLWDIHIGALSITEDREKSVFFTRPYLSSEAVFYVAKNSSTISTLDDLNGKRIAVCAGCTFEQYLEGNLELPIRDAQNRIRNATIIAYYDESSALSDLFLNNSSHIDAVLTDQPVGEAAILRGMKIRPVEPPAFYSYMAAAVDRQSRENSTSFIRIINEKIQEMHDDGTLRTISVAHYSKDYTEMAKNYPSG